MKRIFLSFAFFFFVYIVSVVALNILPQSTPQEPTVPTPQIQLQDPEASPSGSEALPLMPDL